MTGLSCHSDYKQPHSTHQTIETVDKKNQKDGGFFVRQGCGTQTELKNMAEEIGKQVRFGLEGLIGGNKKQNNN